MGDGGLVSSSGEPAADTWREIKDTIRADLLSRGLKEPRIRLAALDRLEQLVLACYPAILNNPQLLLGLSKQEVVAALARAKPTGLLNTAESSVLNQALALLRQGHLPPREGGTSQGRDSAASPVALESTVSDATRPDGLQQTNQSPVPRSWTRSRIAGSGGIVAVKHGLAPVVDGDSRILILGTIPGDESLRMQQYYAHSRNQFWAIIAEVYCEWIGGNYEERVGFLRRKGLALWDVLQSAARPGSLDSAIRNGTPNDFVGFFEIYPKLRIIGFNGSTASSLFRKHVATEGSTARSAPKSTDLPSTSPTPGRNVLPYDGKVARWREFLVP